MTDTQDRLEERLTRVETTLNNARPVEGSRVAVAFWVDDITALLAALRQSQDIEAAGRCDFDCDACRAEVEE